MRFYSENVVKNNGHSATHEILMKLATIVLKLLIAYGSKNNNTKLYHNTLIEF